MRYHFESTGEPDEISVWGIQESQMKYQFESTGEPDEISV